MGKKDSIEKTVRNIRRQTRKKYSAEDKIRIVLEGLRGETTIAELCRREGINSNLYYRWAIQRLVPLADERPASQAHKSLTPTARMVSLPRWSVGDRPNSLALAPDSPCRYINRRKWLIPAMMAPRQQAVLARARGFVRSVPVSGARQT